MKKTTIRRLLASSTLLVMFFASLAQAQQQALFQSYSAIDLSTQPPVSRDGAGSSTVQKDSFTFNSSSLSGASFDSTQKAWKLSGAQSDNGITFDFVLTHPTVVQITMQAAATSYTKMKNGKPVLDANGNPVQVSNNPVGIQINGVSLFQQFNDSNTSFHQVAWDIPANMLQTGSNSILVYLNAGATTDYLVKSATLTARKIYASDGVLNTTLFAQFAETSQVTGIADATDNSIWTRAYGLVHGTAMIPAPTFHFSPGDLVNVDLVNMLDPTHNDDLQQFEELNNLSVDETLASDHLRHEVNIPHNLNNTNLHVHGLHVDPAKDDVTIVITPNDDLPDSAGFPYDAPNSPTPTGEGLNEGSVSDQSVKNGNWVYQYKIPEIHLPGTHWYHPHKHGSTAAQVENGLSGSIVILEDESNAVVPYPGQPLEKVSFSGGGVGPVLPTQTNYDRQDWEDNHDRVLVIQEISNYGVQLGQANGQGDSHSPTVSSARDVTVNGKNPYQIGVGQYDTIVAGQLERWRLINAGTNHRAISHVWLGKKNTAGDYESVDNRMYLVAVDGITLSEKIAVSADKPLLLSPGNRSDVLVQFDSPGDYKLFKNFPTKDADGNAINYAASVDTTSPINTDPYLLTQNSQPLNNQNYEVNWNVGGTSTKTPMVPIIKVKPTTDNNFIDVDFAFAGLEVGAAGAGQWQPYVDAGGGGSADTSVLMNVTVGCSMASGSSPCEKITSSPQMPGDSYMTTIAPAGNMTNTPSYVSKFQTTDILQSRPVVFDVSGAQLNVHGANKPVTQFTLNGRIFALNDPIGNPIANAVIGTGISSTNEIDMGDRLDGSLTAHINFQDRVGAYSNKTNDYGLWWWVNPGFFQEILQGTNGDYSFSGKGMPSWTSVSGLEKPGVVNSTHANSSAISSIPGLPVAQTAEEWILINNSGVSHPFHIHINPFLVEEVGQLSYEAFEGGTSQWVMRAVTSATATIQRESMNASTSPVSKAGGVYQANMGVDGIVGNWWDTILIPPHGYVKVKYWFNVPNQTALGNQISVQDNFNKEGIWVYHCHILRHEDRGMMMPVITQKNAVTE